MTDREKAQQSIYKFILKNADYFNGPVLEHGLQSVGGGKVRTVYFSINRYLDGTITIWSATKIVVTCAGGAKKIVVTCSGGLHHLFEGEYDSTKQLINHFKKEIKK
jgi:hypothetical protein